MTALPVEWVLVIHYGVSAHRATYGRLPGNNYTKDYIQLSRKPEFVDEIRTLFTGPQSKSESVPISYRWPLGEAAGKFIEHSADRPHLSWETSAGAPTPWKMTPAPNDETAETIPGNPHHKDPEAADAELAGLSDKGAGRPVLLAIKLQGQENTFQVRAYLAGASSSFAWADVGLLPAEVRNLVDKTSSSSALAWGKFNSHGNMPRGDTEKALERIREDGFDKSFIGELDAETAADLAAVLEHPAAGLFFDPDKNHDAWKQPPPLPDTTTTDAVSFLEELKKGTHSSSAISDAAAEVLESADELVSAFEAQLQAKDFSVPDAFSQSKTRGSAQKAFSNAIRKNYGSRCAVTGITSKEFLIAAHIVPWGVDSAIRLDPTNGICLSALVDRAFENGFLTIAEDFSISIDWDKIGADLKLREALAPYDGQKLALPAKDPPNPDFLKRRRELIAGSK